MNQNYYAKSGGLEGLGQLGRVVDRVQAPIQPIAYLGANGTAAAGVWKYALSAAQLASMAALGYHGYRRNNSIGWALVWGVFGSIVWPITLPVAFVQGFGKPIRRNRRRVSRR